MAKPGTGDGLEECLPCRVVIQGMKRNWTLGSASPWVFFPPLSLSPVGPGASWELGAAPNLPSRPNLSCPSRSQTHSLFGVATVFCAESWRSVKCSKLPL